MFAQPYIHSRFTNIPVVIIDAYPDKTKQVVQCEVTKLWNEIKEKKTTYDNLLRILNNEVNICLRKL